MISARGPTAWIRPSLTATAWPSGLARSRVVTPALVMIVSAMPFSSELRAVAQAGALQARRPRAPADFVTCRRVTLPAPAQGFPRFSQIGRAACRETVVAYVAISGAA